MTLQVEVELRRVNYVTIHNGSSRAIPASILDAGRWEEPDVVAFANDDDGDIRGNPDFLARR